AAGAAAAAVGAGLATLRPAAPPPRRVRAWLRRDELFEVKATVALIFAFYVGFRWWTVRNDLLAGLTGAEADAARAAATRLAARATLSLGVVVLIGLAGLTAAQLAWRVLIPRVEDAIAEHDAAHEELVETIERPKRSLAKLVGSGALVAGFAWMLARDAGGSDLVEAVLFGMSAVCLYQIVGAVGDIVFVRDAGLPDGFIEVRLKREGGRLIVYLATTFAALAALVYAIDAALGLYFTHVIAPAAEGIAGRPADLLSRAGATPAGVVAYYAFFRSGRVALLGTRLLGVLLPVSLVVVVVPYAVKYLYFRGVRRTLMVGLTYAGVVAVSVLVEFLLSGEVTSLREIGAASLLPTVGAGVSAEAAKWLAEEREYVQCDACGERIRKGANYCDRCGHELG
ncbi:MAG: hypothetical protein ABEH40_08735, partial [Haloferacaceae archaeon]